MSAEIQFPGDEEADEKRIEDRNGRRFGRRKDPAQDATDDDPRHHQGRQGLPETTQALSPAGLLTGKLISMPDRDDVIGEAKAPPRRMPGTTPAMKRPATVTRLSHMA